MIKKDRGYIEDILDTYHCKKCGGTMLRRITYDNIVNQDEIKFCPFCGNEYEQTI